MLIRLSLLVLVAVPAAAQPARILDINPDGPDAVQSRSTVLAYTPETVDREPFDRVRFAMLGSFAHFFANDGTTGIELWRTDGTADGTTRVADLAPGAGSAFLTTPVPFRGALYFAASTGGSPSSRFLYRYNGTDVDLVVPRDLTPVGATEGGLFLIDDQNEGLLLGSCDDNGSGGLICAFTPFTDVDGDNLGTPTAVSLGDATYFAAEGVMYRSLLTPETTLDLFPNRRSATTPSTTDVIGGVGRPYRLGAGLLFDCFYARELPTVANPVGDVQGVELCGSSGGFDDVRLVSDLHPGEQSPDFEFVGVYGEELYAVGRDPGDRAEFLLWRTSGGAWSRAALNATEFYRNTSANDVRMLEAGRAVGYFAERARSTDPFPLTEQALFRSDGTRVTADGEGWASVRPAGADGRGLFAAVTGAPDRAAALYRWDGAGGVVALGPLPGLPTTVTPFERGVLMDVGGELWGYGVGRRTLRQTLSTAGTATFALTLDGAALPLTLDVSALASGGEVQADLLLAPLDTLAAEAPAEAVALLDPFYRIEATPALGGLEAALTVSYTDAAVAAAGIASEATLEVWKTTGEGGWTRLDVTSRDMDANTLTTDAITSFSDIVIGTLSPVAAEGRAPNALLALSAPAPNPSRRSASVTLALGEGAVVRATLADALGREVALVHEGPLASGSHRLDLDTAALAPGLYVVRVAADDRVATQRVVVAR